MAVSPTPQQREYGNDSATERRINGSVAFWTPGGFHLYYWMNLFSLLVASLGLLGNGAVLWLLGFRIQRTPFSVYILNLAGADALFLCCSLLLSLMRLVTCFHPGMCMVVIYLQYISYIVGLSLLAAISTERCLSALFPIWYRCHRPKHMSATVCLGLWVLLGVIEVIEFVTENYVCPGCSYNFIIVGAWLLLLTCVMCVSSLTLLLRVQCSSRRRRPPRLYLLILLTVLVFLLCGLPWGIDSFMYKRFRIDLMPDSLRQPLACVNSSVNPFIYFFVGKRGHKGKESLRLVLQRAVGEEQEVGGGMRGIPHTNT